MAARQMADRPIRARRGLPPARDVHLLPSAARRRPRPGLLDHPLPADDDDRVQQPELGPDSALDHRQYEVRPRPTADFDRSYRNAWVRGEPRALGPDER